MQRNHHGADHEQRRGNGEAKLERAELPLIRARSTQVGKAEPGRQHRQEDEAPERKAGETTQTKWRGQPAPDAAPSPAPGPRPRHTIPHARATTRSITFPETARPMSARATTYRPLHESRLACFVKRTLRMRCA